MRRISSISAVRTLSSIFSIGSVWALSRVSFSVAFIPLHSLQMEVAEKGLGILGLLAQDLLPFRPRIVVLKNVEALDDAPLGITCSR